MLEAGGTVGLAEAGWEQDPNPSPGDCLVANGHSENSALAGDARKGQPLYKGGVG